MTQRSKDLRLSDEDIKVLRNKGAIDKDGICFALLCAASTEHQNNDMSNLTFNLMSWLHTKIIGTDPGPNNIAEAFFRACGQMGDSGPKRRDKSCNKDSVARGISISAVHCPDINAYCGQCTLNSPGRGWGLMWDVDEYIEGSEEMCDAYDKGLVSRTRQEEDDDGNRGEPEWTKPSNYDLRLCDATGEMLSRMIKDDHRALVAFIGI